jgi:hypothetical protein
VTWIAGDLAAVTFPDVTVLGVIAGARARIRPAAN